MKRAVTLFWILMLVIGMPQAFAQSTKKMTQVLELSMPEEGLGNNGASVVWHPGLKKYYAGYAGNEEYCLAVFDERGVLVSSADLLTQLDLRALWFHNGAIEGNCYDQGGWFRYKLDESGIPYDYEIIQPGGDHQPGVHSPGTIDSKAGKVYFLGEEGAVFTYDYKTGESKGDLFYLKMGPGGSLGENGDAIIEYNSSNLFFTGQKKAEFAVINVENREAEFYDAKTLKLTRKASFPSSAPLPTFLNCAYTNGIFFVFDKDNKKWYGYK